MSNREGLFWNKDPEGKESLPVPSYNSLSKLVHNFLHRKVASRYLSNKDFDAFYERYERATDEIIRLYNSKTELIRQLLEENENLKKQLEKWTEHQGKGRPRNKKVEGRTEDIKNWWIEGVPKREIARRLDVDESIIRRILKNNI